MDLLKVERIELLDIDSFCAGVGLVLGWSSRLCWSHCGAGCLVEHNSLVVLAELLSVSSI